MAAWSDVGSTYAEAVQGIFPLHRACIFFFGLTSSLAIEKDRLTPAIDTISELRLSEFASISAGFFKEATVLNITFGCLAVISALTLSFALTRFLTYIINKSTNFLEKAKSLDRSWTKNLNIEDRKNAIEFIDQGISDARTRIQHFSGCGELAAGISATLIACSLFTGTKDFGVSMAIFFMAVLLHGVKMHIFFKDFFGPALTKAQLQGKSVPSAMS